MARALGDFNLHPYITARPQIHGPFSIGEGSQASFLIIACDGLWDVVPDEEAVQLVLENSDPEEAAMMLRSTALQKGSEDNISLVVIFFPYFYEMKR